MSAIGTELDSDYAAAFARRDGATLAALHLQAADIQEARGAVDAACFELVQAYIYALEAGAPLAEDARRRLHARGREA